MIRYEYKVIPAPKKGRKAKGLRTSEARFANALQDVMNEMGAEGWEYLRCDTLPAVERQGLTGKATVYQNMLVFGRQVKTGPDKARAVAQLAAASGTGTVPPLTRAVTGDVDGAGAAKQPAGAGGDDAGAAGDDAPGADTGQEDIRDTLSETLIGKDGDEAKGDAATDGRGR